MSLLRKLYSRQRGTAVVIQGGRALLVRDRGKKSFSLPGGGIKKGESATRAVARELYEELQLKALHIQRLKECDYKGSLNRHHVCMVTEISGNPHLQEDEVDEFIWWDTQEPVPVYAHVKYILTRLPSEYRCLVTGIEQLV
ncbi:NUDIX domain-containing protein [Chloroflexota bacterium]